MALVRLFRVHALLVLEVVAVSRDDVSGREKHVSCGWGYHKLFAHSGELSDLSSGSSGLMQK